MSDRDERNVDPADAVLGDPNEVERVAEAARHDRVLGGEVESLRATAERLEALPAEAWDPVEPPPLQVPDAEVVPLARRVRGRRMLVAAAVVVGLVIGGAGIGLLVSGSDTSESDRTVALGPVDDGPEGAAATVRLTRDRASGAELSVEGIAPNRANQFYELWLLNSVDDLVSLGTFRVPRDGRATVRVPLPVDPNSYQFFDVSLEDDDGNPAHSTVSVLRGPTV